jgi:hypothetical protein
VIKLSELLSCIYFCPELSELVICGINISMALEFKFFELNIGAC